MAAKAVPKECSAVSAEPRKARQTAKRAGTARKKKAEEMGFGAVFLGLNMQIINYFDYDDKTSIILQLEKLQGEWRAIGFLLSILKKAGCTEGR